MQRLSPESVVDQLAHQLAESRRSRIERQAAYLALAQAILTEAGLSFLGVGLDPSTPSWGTMLNDGRDYLLTAWWISAMPGIAIGFTVLGVMLLGEGLRELLDPRGTSS